MQLTQKHLATRIARAREKAGLSQGALAELMGLAQSAISRIEAGERTIESLELARLAKALDISVLDLLEEDPLAEQLLVAARAEVAESAVLDKALNRVIDLVRLDQLVAEADEPAPPRPNLDLPRLKNRDPVDDGAHLARW